MTGPPRPHFDAALDAWMALEPALVALAIDPRPHHRNSAINAAKRIILELAKEGIEDIK